SMRALSTHTLSLHDALPISSWNCTDERGPAHARAPARPVGGSLVRADGETLGIAVADGGLLPVVHRFEERHRRDVGLADGVVERSEEHTSELQSRFELVCRL